jgi:uncharacterized protein YjiS (DUF1127 family)
MRFSFALGLCKGRRFGSSRQGKVHTLPGFDAKRPRYCEKFMNIAMHLLHGSIEHTVHCATAASGYICPNGPTDKGRDRQRYEAKQMAYVNSTRAASGSFQDRLTAITRYVRAAVLRRRMYRQTARELNGLTDRELADLGIHRADIRQIATEAACGK